jgi:hypothetical protein
MSLTYELVCDDCKVHYWAGQGHARKGSHYLYSLELVGKFLEEHQGHRLRYVLDGTDDNVLDYIDWEPQA